MALGGMVLAVIMLSHLHGLVGSSMPWRLSFMGNIADAAGMLLYLFGLFKSGISGYGFRS